MNVCCARGVVRGAVRPLCVRYGLLSRLRSFHVVPWLMRNYLARHTADRPVLPRLAPTRPAPPLRATPRLFATAFLHFVSRCGHRMAF